MSDNNNNYTPLQWNKLIIVFLTTQSLSVNPLTHTEQSRYEQLLTLFNLHNQNYKQTTDYLNQNNIKTATNLTYTPKRLFGVIQKVHRHYHRKNHCEVKSVVIVDR